MGNGSQSGPLCRSTNAYSMGSGTLCLAAAATPNVTCRPIPNGLPPPKSIPSYNKPARAAQEVSIPLGAAMTWDSVVRELYNRGAKAIAEQAAEFVRTGNMTVDQAKVWANGQRNALVMATRDKTSPLGRAIAEAIKPSNKLKSVEQLEKIGKSAEGIIQSAGKTNPWVNRVAVGFRYAGPTLLVISVAFSAYNIATAPPEKRWKVVVEEAGVWAGALSGGWAGARGGATIGTFIEPGGGTAVGGVVGAILGGIGGALFGGWVGTEAGEFVYEAMSDAGPK